MLETLVNSCSLWQPLTYSSKQNNIHWCLLSISCVQSIVWWWMCISFFVGNNANIFPGLQERKLRFKETIVSKLISKVRVHIEDPLASEVIFWTPLSFVSEDVFIDDLPFWVIALSLFFTYNMYFQSREFHVRLHCSGLSVAIDTLCHVSCKTVHLTLYRVCLISVPLSYLLFYL